MARGKECVRVQKWKKLNKCQGSNLRWSDRQKVILLKRESCESLRTLLCNARQFEFVGFPWALPRRPVKLFSRFDLRPRFQSSRNRHCTWVEVQITGCCSEVHVSMSLTLILWCGLEEIVIARKALGWRSLWCPERETCLYSIWHVELFALLFPTPAIFVFLCISSSDILSTEMLFALQVNRLSDSSIKTRWRSNSPWC